MITHRIGAHVSIAKGMTAALNKAQSMGANCVQIFSSSPRSFGTPNKSDAECTQFKTEAQKRDIGPNFIHATYLINLASPNKDLRQKSIISLITDLRFAEKIGSRGSIVHTGSHQGAGFETVVPVVVAAIKEILSNSPTVTKLYLEIASGGNGKIGSTFEELATLLEKVNNPRLGVCLDTAHMFAGGYSYSTPQELTKLVKHISHTIGWGVIECLHTNDSKSKAGSFLDRHENIGKGEIGKEAFKLLLHDDHFGKLPFILEVPGIDGKSGPDEANIKILQSLI